MAKLKKWFKRKKRERERTVRLRLFAPALTFVFGLDRWDQLSPLYPDGRSIPFRVRANLIEKESHYCSVSKSLFFQQLGGTFCDESMIKSSKSHRNSLLFPQSFLPSKLQFRKKGIFQIMTSTTTTTTHNDEASLPKNPMRSTWYNKPEEELDFAQRLIRRLGVLPDEDKINQAPVAKKGDKVPYYPVWNQHLFIFPRAIVPLVLHRLYMELFPGWTMHPIIAVPFYFFAAKAFALSSLGKFNELSYKYGFFDGEKPRDKVPDVHSKKVLWSLLGVLSIRPLLAVFAFYNREEKPSLSIWFPLQLCLYSVTLDFFFYIYHRAMHEVPGLWQFHSRHHRTKHPNALLGAFADVPQEWGDIAVIPVLTWLVLRYDFSTWYMCNVYSLYTEAFGHTGIRLYWQTPASGPFLRPFGAELILEDHDLHHQKGHRKSHAYGKQSALWDHIFGTKPKRVECTEDLIDWNHRVN